MKRDFFSKWFIFYSLATILIGAFTFSACTPIDVKDNYDDVTAEDIIPPKITGFSVSSSKIVIFSFSKPITPLLGEFSLDPQIEFSSIENSETMENSLVITFSENPEVGEKYTIKGNVKDYSDNTLSFSTSFFGFNPNVPQLLINEFTTNGSPTHPDLVEILVQSSGNMAGTVFYAGCSSDFDLEYIFPSVEVKKGEYLLIHTKPKGIPEEIDETGEKGTSTGPDSSGGLDAFPEARDFWIKDGSGLTSSNGALTIYTSSGGTLLDAVIYSTRTSSSDQTYRGFGSNAMIYKVDTIVEELGWQKAGELLTPEECINPSISTATRSICRSSIPVDTNTKADWHIVPTSTYSFGTVNSDEVYTPTQ